MAARLVSGVVVLQLLLVQAHRQHVHVDDDVAEQSLQSIGADDAEGSDYCDNECPEGMTTVKKLDAEKFPMLDEEDRKLVPRCVAEGVQEPGYPPFFILNTKVKVKSGNKDKEKIFYGVGRLDMMSLTTAVFQKAIANELEKTQEVLELEGQLKADYEEVSEIHEHHGSHAHGSGEIIGHWLVEEGMLKASKYGLKYLAYNVIGHAATSGAIVSGMASLIGIMSTFSVMFFPVTFSLQWTMSVQEQSNTIAEAGRMGSYLFYKYHWIMLFPRKPNLQKNKMNREFVSMCGDDVATAMLRSLRATTRSVEGLLRPLTDLGGCTVPASTAGPGGDKVTAKTKCIKQVWDILSLGPMFPAAKMAVLYGTVADQFIPNLWSGLLKKVWNVEPSEAPDVLQSIRNSSNITRACELTVTMDKFYKLLFDKLRQVMETWIQSFLREYGTGMICSRNCKGLINAWSSGRRQATCNYSHPRAVHDAIFDNGVRSVFHDIPMAHVPWGSFRDAFKKTILKRKA